MIQLENDVVYHEGKILIRKSIPSDTVFLANRLCQGDVDEIWATHHLTPKEGLEISFNRSLISLTVESNEEIICMLGICPDNLIDTKAMIWMVASTNFKKIGIPFLWKSRDFVTAFLQSYKKLYNYVDARHSDSLRWLKFIGAKIEEPKPYGIDGLPFHYFSFEG